jgi:hypothetical protein
MFLINGIHYLKIIKILEDNNLLIIIKNLFIHI